MLAIAYNAILFISFFLITTPLLNSSDNAFCLYLMGGGFGNAPTELIYYNHLLHPLITIPVKELFLLNANINWYSVVLILFHFLACSVIFNRILKLKPLHTGIIIYTLFFCIFEAHFLLSLTFTSTSLILTISAIIILLTSGENKRLNFKHILISAVLLVSASLFRIYTILPVVGIALPLFVFFLKKKDIITVCLSFTAVIVIICINSYTQREYYKHKIPNWSNEEQYRQILYGFFNDENAYHGLDSTWEIEEKLLKDALIIDTNFLSTEKLLQMQKESQRNSSQNIFNSERFSFKWFVINNRIFIGYFIFLMLFGGILNRKYIFASIISFACLILGIVFLYLFAKLPDYIFLSGLTLLSLLISSIGFNSPRKGLLLYANIAGMVFFMVWGIVRIYKENLKNLNNHLHFRQAATEVANYPDKLFFVTDYTFPSDYISVFDVPQKYPLTNVVLGWHYSYSYSLQMLKKFGINDIKDLPQSQNVLLWGKPVKELLDYFSKTAKLKLQYSPPLPQFKYGEVRKLQILQ